MSNSYDDMDDAELEQRMNELDSIQDQLTTGYMNIRRAIEDADSADVNLDDTTRIERSMDEVDIKAYELDNETDEMLKELNRRYNDE